jgi:hypothetical protein
MDVSMDALKHSHSQQTKALATRLRKEKYDAKGVIMRVYLTQDMLSKGADLRDKNMPTHVLVPHRDRDSSQDDLNNWSHINLGHTDTSKWRGGRGLPPNYWFGDDGRIHPDLRLYEEKVTLDSFVEYKKEFPSYSMPPFFATLIAARDMAQADISAGFAAVAPLPSGGGAGGGSSMIAPPSVVTLQDIDKIVYHDDMTSDDKLDAIKDFLLLQDPNSGKLLQECINKRSKKCVHDEEQKIAAIAKKKEVRLCFIRFFVFSSN